MYIKGSRIISILNQCIKTLSKAIGKQRQQHRMKVRETLANDHELPTETASEFLKNSHLQARVHTAILNLASSFDVASLS